MFCQPLLLACKRQGNVDMLESFLWQICLSAAVSAELQQVWMKKSDIVVGFPCFFNASPEIRNSHVKGKEMLTCWSLSFGKYVSALPSVLELQQVWMKKSDIVVGFPCYFHATSKIRNSHGKARKHWRQWHPGWPYFGGCSHINLTKNLGQVEQRQPSKQRFASFAVVALSKQVLPRIQSHRPLQKTIIKFGTSSNLGCSYVSRSCLQDHCPAANHGPTASNCNSFRPLPEAVYC